MIEHPSILTSTEKAMWEAAWTLLSGDCAKRYTAPLIDPPGTQEISVARFTSRSNIEYQVFIRDIFCQNLFTQSLIVCERNRIIFEQSISGGDQANQDFDRAMIHSGQNYDGEKENVLVRFDEDYLGLCMTLTNNADYTLSSGQVLMLLLLPAKITKP